MIFRLAVLALAAFSGLPPDRPPVTVRTRPSVRQARNQSLFADIERYTRALAPLRAQRVALLDRAHELTATVHALAVRNTAQYASARCEPDRVKREAVHRAIADIKERKAQLMAARDRCRDEARALLTPVRELEGKIRHIERKIHDERFRPNR